MDQQLVLPKCGAKICFGNKLVYFDNDAQVESSFGAVSIAQLDPFGLETEVVRELSTLLSIILSGRDTLSRLVDFCSESGTESSDKFVNLVWKFLLIHIEKRPTFDYVSEIGIGDFDENDLHNSTSNTEKADPDTAANNDHKNRNKRLLSSVVSGDYEKAIEICVDQGRWPDAFHLAHSLGEEHFQQVQQLHLERSASGESRLLYSIAQKNWSDLIDAVDPTDWKLVFAALLHQAEKSKLKYYLRLLGDKLYYCDNVELKKNCVLCYICSGRIDDLFLSVLSMNDVNEGSLETLLLAIETTLVFKCSLGGGSHRVVDYSEDTAKYFVEYIHVLVSSGCLQTALQLFCFLAESTLEKEAIELRYRLYKACPNTAGVSNFPDPFTKFEFPLDKATCKFKVQDLHRRPCSTPGMSTVKLSEREVVRNNGRYCPNLGNYAVPHLTNNVPGPYDPISTSSPVTPTFPPFNNFAMTNKFHTPNYPLQTVLQNGDVNNNDQRNNCASNTVNCYSDGVSCSGDSDLSFTAAHTRLIPLMQRLVQAASSATSDQLVKRRMENNLTKLSYYSQTKGTKLSPCIEACFDQIADAVEANDFRFALLIVQQMATGAYFDEVSSFVPPLKILIQTVVTTLNLRSEGI